MSIRPAVPADLPEVRRITGEAFQPYVERIGMRPVPMDADYGALIGAGSVWVADGGFCVLLFSPEHVVLDVLAVDDAHRGQGLGGQLTAFAEQQATDRGLPEVRLYTHRLMTENHALYRHLGYREVDGPDAGIPRVHFAKRVA